VVYRARRHVIVLVRGGLQEMDRQTLAALLERELVARDLVPRVDAVTGDVRLAVERERRAPDALLIAVVDARPASGWRIYIVDPARDRAISRKLAGGMQADRAALEALTSIVASAAAALAEGLEVASTPIPEVLAPVPPPPPPRRASMPAALAPRPAPASEGEHLVQRSAVLASVATAEQVTPVTAGIAAELGLSVAHGITPRIGVAWHLPAEIETTLGAFRMNRAFAGLGVGKFAPLGRFEFEPEVGVLAERVHRAQAEPRPDASGVSAQPTPESTVYRFAPKLSLRVRYALSDHIALEWVGSGAYFPQAVRFLASAEQTSELAELSRLVALVQLGVEVRGP
jgi:hypothetical protein